MRILVTGGCGFIGSALVLHLVEALGHEVLNLDALTYAANPRLAGAAGRQPAPPPGRGRHLRRGGRPGGLRGLRARTP